MVFTQNILSNGRNAKLVIKERFIFHTNSFDVFCSLCENRSNQQSSNSSIHQIHHVSGNQHQCPACWSQAALCMIRFVFFFSENFRISSQQRCEADFEPFFEYSSKSLEMQGNGNKDDICDIGNDSVSILRPRSRLNFLHFSKETFFSALKLMPVLSRLTTDGVRVENHESPS